MAIDKTNNVSAALQLNGATTIQTQVDNEHPYAEKAMIEEGMHRSRLSFKLVASAYFGALFAMGIIMHFIASVVTAALYFSPVLPFLPKIDPTWYAPVYGTIFCWIFSLLSAVIWSYFTTAEHANPRSYGLLRTRLGQLKARLGIRELTPSGSTNEVAREHAAKMETNEEYRLIALREAYACYTNASRCLWQDRTGIHWSSGVGYINVWGMLHRAEEALIEVEPVEMVIRGAMHDELSIQNSTIANRDELIEKLIQAATDLSPAARVYFKEHQPDTSNADIQQLQRDLAQERNILNQLVQIAKNLKPDSEIIIDDRNTQRSEDEIKAAQTTARFTLREIRRTLNEFRDKRWEGLVNARNQLLGTIATTSFVTHVLLCISILTGLRANHDAILGAIAFYMIGAIAGLFGQVYNESRRDTAIDDYGLSLARLIAIPLLSGLAGIGGVLLTAMLYTTLVNVPPPIPTGSPSSLHTLFQFDDPRYLLAAAIFGLTPNLIIRSMQQRAEKYVSDLANSKSTQQDS